MLDVDRLVADDLGSHSCRDFDMCLDSPLEECLEVFCFGLSTPEATIVDCSAVLMINLPGQNGWQCSGWFAAQSETPQPNAKDTPIAL